MTENDSQTSSHLTPARRTILTGSLGLAAGSMLAGTAPASAQSTSSTATPFTLGVASGDPWPDGFVIWTRLAPKPLSADGFGGMPDATATVEYEVATDESFAQVVRRGQTSTSRAKGHSVHVTITGLAPSSEFFYRFRSDGHISRTGRAVTAPELGSSPQSLRFTMASCANWEHGYFTAYKHMAAERPDIMIHLGDYYYEIAPLLYPVSSGVARLHTPGENYTLANYRRRMAQYKTDPDLQEAHATAPWLVIFDDHEVDNNWASGTPELWDPNFLNRRKAAFQAYYENMPLRESSMPTGYDMQIYRRIRWGQLANFHLLDTRQYRSDQANGDLIKIVAGAALDPKRTITGQAQEDWLREGFNTSTARWDFITQQVPFSQYDHTKGGAVWGDMDSWDGYVASRNRVTQAWIDAKVRNPIVLTGDIHQAFASNIKKDFNDPTAASVGVELITTSISSGGNGSAKASGNLEWNPHIKFNNNLRGYLSVHVTPENVNASFRSVNYVRTQGSPLLTSAVFGVQDADPQVHRIS